jgi:hypothetical protein
MIRPGYSRGEEFEKKGVKKVEKKFRELYNKGGERTLNPE